MKKVVTTEQMREIDRLTTSKYGVPSLALMQNAAAAVVRVIEERVEGGVAEKNILILCGPGNNGGDGAATGRILASLGASVRAVLFGRVENIKGDARTNFERVKDLSSRNDETRWSSISDFEDSTRDLSSPIRIEFYECASIEDWNDYCASTRDDSPAVIVDALFGTGLTRPLEGLFAQVVRDVNAVRVASDTNHPLVFSVDIPSGLNADLPTPIGDCVKADVTITFTAPKPATVLAPSSNHCGELVVADIGSPVSLIEETESSLFALDESDAFSFLLQTRYTPDSYKNTHGHALVIAGSRGMSGAAVLCGSAAMRSGAGLVTIATPASSQPVLASKAMPEIMTVALAETERGAVSNDAIDHVVSLSNKVNVVAVGPGLSSDDERTCNFVRQLVARRITPMVIDADGLNALSPWPSNFKASDELPLVLTPHIGEMRRLIGESNGAETEDRVAIAREFATANHVIVVLKGTRTLIAAPDGLVFVNPTGNAGLGTAGAGDTLTGVIAGFLAQSYATLKEKADPVMSTIAAVYVSGLAGDIAAKKIGMRSMVASDIREHLSDAVRQIDPIGERS